MNTIGQNVAIFRADQFKKAYQSGAAKLNIDNKEHVLYAVRKAYVDLTPRTLKKKNPNAKIPAPERNNVLWWLAEELQVYLQDSTKESFSVWHRSVCRQFLVKFNTEVLADNYHPAHFGKAQKIVNMALKYIRCFDDAAEYESIYKECHMAIDSYILTWYNNELSVALQVPKVWTAWGNLSEQEYDTIQNNIATYLESTMNTKFSRIPFEAEFDIWWSEKQLRLQKK